MNRMSLKQQRREAIRLILGDGRGASHEEIVAALKSRGITASQATVSRDLREMGVVKMPVNGRTSYRLSSSVNLLGRSFQGFDISYEAVGNLVVIKTTSGRAPGLCVLIDRQAWPEVAGTVAGDDTILVVARSNDDAALVLKRLEDMRGNSVGGIIV